MLSFFKRIYDDAAVPDAQVDSSARQDEPPSCTFCASGYYGFGVCTFCNGGNLPADLPDARRTSSRTLPRKTRKSRRQAEPVVKKTLQTELLIKRKTSTYFLMQELSSERSEGCACALKEQEVFDAPSLEEQECSICAAAVADVVLRPCGHGGICEDCARHLTSSRTSALCPYCREPIDAFMKIDPKQEVSVVREEFQVKFSQRRR